MKEQEYIIHDELNAQRAFLKNRPLYCFHCSKWSTYQKYQKMLVCNYYK